MPATQLKTSNHVSGAVSEHNGQSASAAATAAFLIGQNAYTPSPAALSHSLTASLPPKKNLLQRTTEQPVAPHVEHLSSTTTPITPISIETTPRAVSSNHVFSPSSMSPGFDGYESDPSSPTGPQHTPGDLVWARVSGYPWWPSMITNDPVQNVFFKPASGTSKKFLYHVQFFGSVPERAWINWKSLFAFEAASQFEELPSPVAIKTKLKKGAGPGRKPVEIKKPEKNEVPPSKRLWWEDSLKEANEAKGVDKCIRLDKYLKFKQTDKAIPSALISPAPKPKNSTGPKRKTISDLEPQSNGETPLKKLKDNSDFIQGIFDLYKTKHEKAVKDKYPDYTEDELEAFLHHQWKNLDTKIKEKYRNRFENPDLKQDSGDETDPGDEETLVERARPMRKCVLTLGNNAYKGSAEATEEAKKEESPAKPAVTRKSIGGTPAASKPQSGPGRRAANHSPGSVEIKSLTFPELRSRSPIPILTAAQALDQANAEGHMDEVDEISGSTGLSALKEYICKICETTGELLLCEGDCSGAFHVSCLGMEDVPDGEFKCDECIVGTHSCFVCRRSDSTVKPCGVLYCGKYYHDDCLKTFPLARISFEGELVCPLHACATCGFRNSKSPDVYRGKMHRCVRCPVAYHCGDGDGCLAAGSAVLAPNSIICCKHFMPVANNKNHVHVNVSWCFVCSQGGSLLCCEQCPASFHLKCIGLTKLPKDDNWFCNSCLMGLRPKYGDILWVKVQNYRWWPAEVIYPRMIPQKSMEEPHQVGEFLVQLFATKEYHWVHIGRTFLFHENDKSFHEVGEKSFPKNYELAIQKACEVMVRRKGSSRISSPQLIEDDDDDRPIADLMKPLNINTSSSIITPIPTQPVKKPPLDQAVPSLDEPVFTGPKKPAPRPKPKYKPKPFKPMPFSTGKKNSSPSPTKSDLPKPLSFQPSKIPPSAAATASSPAVKSPVTPIAPSFAPLTVEATPSSLPEVPPAYKLVNQNQPVGNVEVYSADITEITPCECKATDVDPCGATSDCWNRLLCVECHPKVCRAGDRCSNQRFQKAQYPRFEIFFTRMRGWALKTLNWIKKGDFVNEYCGDLIDINECQRRLQFQNDIGDLNFYFCVLDKERIIDSGPAGNFSRFMNHSCDPNCETQKWTVNGDIRVGLFALIDVPPGTELTFNYNMDCLGNSKLKCKCNSPACSGYIGVKPLKGSSTNDRERKHRKRLKREKPEDICFRCGKPGSSSGLITCQRFTCGKFYHMTCVQLDENPGNQWDCPLHYCDICQKVAVYLCSQCDHSTCQEHEKGLMYELTDHTFRCNTHYQILLQKTRENKAPSSAPTPPAPGNSVHAPMAHSQHMDYRSNGTAIHAQLLSSPSGAKLGVNSFHAPPHS